jgi:hypothetical protein
MGGWMGCCKACCRTLDAAVAQSGHACRELLATPQLHVLATRSIGTVHLLGRVDSLPAGSFGIVYCCRQRLAVQQLPCRGGSMLLARAWSPTCLSSSSVFSNA